MGTMKRTIGIMTGGLAAMGLAGVVTLPCDATENLEEWFVRSNGVYSAFEAAYAGNLDVLQQRLAEGGSPNGRNELGDTPLHLAAAAGQLQAVQALLDAGADSLAKDAAGRIPSQRAANEACAAACRRQEEVRRREISFFPAVAANDTAAVQEALCRGLNPNAFSEDCSNTLLGTAVQCGATETAQALLKAGANARRPLPSGLSLLHLAAQKGQAAMIPLLLEAGVDPMARANNGALAIHEAIWYGRTEAALALIPAYKAQGYNPEGGHNGYPVRMAIWRGHTRIVQAFLEAGLDPNAPAFRDEPLLVHAVRHGRTDMVRLLLHAGADKNATDSSGKRAADYATGDIAALLK